MNIIQTELPGVMVFEPKQFRDDRGFFLETFHHERYAKAGITLPFVQDNWSHSVKGTLRGLHFQEPKRQGKLVHVVAGKVFDVAVDIRKGSPTFGKWAGVELSAENKRQLWLPPGFAHGFYVMSDYADFLYKCTEAYAPECDRGIAWNDPAIGIKWPLAGDPLLSPKDAKLPLLKDAPTLPVAQ
ncbi:MAG: dTDP-4-dehydrorhamnose 3,5-epimerase [Myxococcaceae bacterium]|nr:dTDP-4-dehydrorhamnose 3,5-epimerase [Myxococcaceae bacterium]